LARLAPSRLLEQLPAVFRERDAERGDFLADFLQAFEAVFDGIRAEAELATSLFAVNPTPALREYAEPQERILYLDSAAGLCGGDVVQIEDVLRPAGILEPRVEFATVAELRGRPLPAELPLSTELKTLTPSIAELRKLLRYGHVQGSPVRRVGRPVASVPLVGVGVPEAPGPRLQALTLASPDALGAAVGDVVRIGSESFEFAQIAAAHGSVLVVTPPLLEIPPADTPVALLEPAPTTTPPPALEHAERSGRELVVVSPAHAGSFRVELDTLVGLAEGDVLELRQRDAQRSEIRRIEELPAKEMSGRGIPTLTLRLHRSLRYDHPAGGEVAVLEPAGREARLAEAAAPGASTVSVDDPGALAGRVGAAVRIGSGEQAEYAHVRGLAGAAVTVDPPLSHPHTREEPVARLETRSGGTGFLAWLGAAVGLELRADRGERWNRELVRLVGALWPWRGTRRAVEEFLRGYVRGEVGRRRVGEVLERQGVEVVDAANPLQLGLVSTLGYDTVVCGRPNFFWVDLSTNRRSHRMYQPQGIEELLRAAHRALRREKPAHTFYDIRLYANTMQLGLDSANEVGARLGDTTLLWDEPLLVAGDEERR
jgi:hypothetical protein